MILTDGDIDMEQQQTVKRMISNDRDRQTSLHTFSFGNHTVAKEIAVAGSGQHTMYDRTGNREQ